MAGVIGLRGPDIEKRSMLRGAGVVHPRVGRRGHGLGKRPWRIERADGAAMCVPALAGHHWEDKGSDAFALVTVEPNRFVGSFHDRMSGQLPDGLVPVWLSPEGHGGDALAACLVPPPDEELVAYPLPADAGKARHDDPAALEAVGPAVTWRSLQETSPRGQQKRF